MPKLHAIYATSPPMHIIASAESHLYAALKHLRDAMKSPIIKLSDATTKKGVARLMEHMACSPSSDSAYNTPYAANAERKKTYLAKAIMHRHSSL